ncbi:hypothetical protein [Leyella stercorea]|uniref:hypothetical protein n=1 Tax=Leyella stercorea TaxID=363265 RepID=UPI0024311D91|nr:hypothetical protein [Leyella stercorea]
MVSERLVLQRYIYIKHKDSKNRSSQYLFVSMLQLCNTMNDICYWKRETKPPRNPAGCSSAQGKFSGDKHKSLQVDIEKNSIALIVGLNKQEAGIGQWKV